MGNRPSLKHQVIEALNSISAIDESRHQAKQDGTADRIFCWGTYNTHRDRVVPFAKFCETEHGVKWLYDLRPAQAGEYIAQMIDRDLSSKYIQNVIGSVRKLDIAMAHRGWTHRGGPLAADLHAPKGGEHRYGYAPADAQAIVNRVVATAEDPRIGRIVRLLDTAGLRIHEAVQLKTDHIDVPAARVLVQGKGGKERWAACEDQGLLQEILDVAKSNRFAFNPAPRTIRTVQETVVRARKALQIETLAMPCHGFRATFAERFYEARCAEGRTDQEAREALAVQLGHNHAVETRAYVPAR